MKEKMTRRKKIYTNLKRRCIKRDKIENVINNGNIKQLEI